MCDMPHLSCDMTHSYLSAIYNPYFIQVNESCHTAYKYAHVSVVYATSMYTFIKYAEFVAICMQYADKRATLMHYVTMQYVCILLSSMQTSMRWLCNMGWLRSVGSVKL